MQVKFTGAKTKQPAKLIARIYGAEQLVHIRRIWIMQITPRALITALSNAYPAAAKRAFEAMMTMRKIDIAAIEAVLRADA